MAVRRTPLQSYVATVAKFKRMGATMDAAANEIRRDLARDQLGFVTGASPSGKARLKWLKEMGHPFGRGGNAASSTPTGRKRGVGFKGGAPTLPIGEITGALKSSAFTTLKTTSHNYLFTVGFNRKAGNSIWVVMPGGTKKMVGRGLWSKNEGGALGQRVKLYRKAFRDTFLRSNRQP